MVALLTVAAEWLRLGCIGFGGPPAHIAFCGGCASTSAAGSAAAEFEDAIATTNLLPGPASTQLAIFCAWRLRGTVGAILGGVCFIVPGLALILALSAVFLEANPPDWIVGAAAGAGAAVPAVAVSAARGLVPASWKRIGAGRARAVRWIVYALAGGAAAATVGPYLVLVLVVLRCRRGRSSAGPPRSPGRYGGSACGRVHVAVPPAGSAPWCGRRSRSVRCPTAAVSSSSR